MRPIQERLTMLAADLREDSRKAGIAAEQARPDVKKAADILTARREHIEELEAQLAEIKAQLADARAGHQEATEAHAEALAALAGHERDGQEAAAMAARLDQLARGHRAPDDLPPAEALAATGLMPPKEAEPESDPDGPYAEHIGKRVELITKGGSSIFAVLAMSYAGHLYYDIDDQRCFAPLETFKDVRPVADEDWPDDDPPAPREPVATPPVPTAPAPDMTMPDLGISPVPLPPATTNGEPRHAAPRDSTSTGRMRALGERIGIVHRDEPAGEQQGDGENGGGQ